MAIKHALLTLLVGFTLQCMAAPTDPSATFSIPTQIGNDQNVPTASTLAAIDPWLFGCSDEEKIMVQEAWREASILADGHYEWVPGGTWQPAMSMYVGDKSKDDGSFWTGPGELQNNIFRQWRIHHSFLGQEPINTYAYIYCHEDKLPEKHKNPEPVCGPGTTAFTFDDPGKLWTVHYVALCPTWWDRSRMASLADLTRQAQYDTDMQVTINEWRRARSRSLFHESYHWGRTVSVPRCDVNPERYNPSDVVDLAKGDINVSKINAESWAQAALAIYIQKTFGRNTPPVPRASTAQVDADTFEEKMLDQPPDWFDAPVKQGAPEFKPQPSPDLVQLGSLGGLIGYTRSQCGGKDYTTEEQCKQFCYEGTCSKQDFPEGVQDGKFPRWQCGNCPDPNTCKNGVYKDFDECGRNCKKGGLCQLTAGVSGVQCRGCP